MNKVYECTGCECAIREEDKCYLIDSELFCESCAEDIASDKFRSLTLDEQVEAVGGECLTAEVCA